MGEDFRRCNCHRLQHRPTVGKRQWLICGQISCGKRDRIGSETGDMSLCCARFLLRGPFLQYTAQCGRHNPSERSTIHTLKGTSLVLTAMGWVYISQSINGLCSRGALPFQYPESAGIEVRLPLLNSASPPASMSATVKDEFCASLVASVLPAVPPPITT